MSLYLSPLHLNEDFSGTCSQEYDPGALKHMTLILLHTADCLPAQLLPVHIPTTRGARECFSSPHPYSPCKVALLLFALLMAMRLSPIVIQFAFLSLLVSFLPLPLPAPWCKPPPSPWELYNLAARGSASILSCPSLCSHTSARVILLEHPLLRITQRLFFFLIHWNDRCSNDDPYLYS